MPAFLAVQMSQITVLFEEIGAKGLEFDRELSVEYLRDVFAGEGPATGFVPAAPARLKGRLEKVSGKVLLSAHTAVKFQGPCKRCLGPARGEIGVDFQLSLVRRAPAPVEDDQGPETEPKKLRDEEGTAGSFDPMASEEEPFDGRTIDLGDLAREQILLNVPMDLICKESCQGLCTVCGKDLNEGECGCERKPADPRWAALKDIKIT
jgi:uncharacterized protein